MHDIPSIPVGFIFRQRPDCRRRVWQDNQKGKGGYDLRTEAYARFIATTIAGEESQRLGQRPGVSLCEVPPLSAAEADAITAQVHARYHREPNKEVMAVLLSNSSSTVRTLPEDKFSRNAWFFMHVNCPTSKCSGKF